MVNILFLVELVVKFWAWGFVEYGFLQCTVVAVTVNDVSLCRPAKFFIAAKFNALDLVATLSFTIHTMQALLAPTIPGGRVVDWLFVFRAISILRAVHLLELLLLLKPFYVILTTIQRIIPAINRVLFTLVATFYFTGAIACHSMSDILNATSTSPALEQSAWYPFRSTLNFGSLAQVCNRPAVVKRLVLITLV